MLNLASGFPGGTVGVAAQASKQCSTEIYVAQREKRVGRDLGAGQSLCAAVSSAEEERMCAKMYVSECCAGLPDTVFAFCSCCIKTCLTQV